MPPINPVTNINERLGPEKLQAGWPWKLFLFSLLTVTTAMVVYLGLVFGYAPFLKVQITQVDEDLKQLSQTIPADQQQGLIIFYSQLVNLKNLLDEHVSSSKIFQFLQKNTNVQVFYTGLDLKMGERKLALEGIAPNYGIFSQQLQAFNSSPEVESLVVSDSSATEGKVKFRLFIILKPETKL